MTVKTGVHLEKKWVTSRGTTCDTYAQAVEKEVVENRTAFCKLIVGCGGKRDVAESLYLNVAFYLRKLKEAGLVIDYTLPDEV